MNKLDKKKIKKGNKVLLAGCIVALLSERRQR